MGYSAIQKTLQNMVASITGGTVIWADQQVPAKLSDYVTLKFTSDTTVGTGAEYRNTGGGPSGSEQTITKIGTREGILQIRAYQGQGEEVGDTSPRAVLANVRASVWLDSNVATLQAGGVSIFDDHGIVDTSTQVGTIIEPQALLEFRFYFLDEPATPDTATYIAQVDGGDLIDSGTFNPFE
jgi:hypothetical protein